MRRVRIVFGVFLLLYSCSPNSSEEFYREGKTRCQVLVASLKKIENREQLLRSEPILKKQFESLVNLMIEAREFQQEHLDNDEGEYLFPERSGDDQLEEELRRIYSIEGGREIIERTQQEALVRLDAYERSLVKKRAQSP